MRSTPAWLLVLALWPATICSAQDPVQQLADVGRHVRASGDLFAFLAAAARMGDVDLDRAALTRVLSRAGGAGHTGPLADLLGATHRLRVRGDELELERDEATTTSLAGTGHLRAAEAVRLRVAPDGALVRVEGLRMGPRADQLLDVQEVSVGESARVRAGPPGREREARLRVSPELAPRAAAGPAAPETSARGTPSDAAGRARGLRGAVEGEAPGTLDISRFPLADRRYKRRAGSRRADVGVRTLPAIDVDGRSARPRAFESGMAIDADGAGDAHRGDGSGQSRTSLAWSHRPGRERYLDPTVTPFVALPIGFERDHPGVRLGDIVAVQRDGRTVFAIYGDRGPRDQLGEASLAVGRALGLTAAQLDPNRGGLEGGVTYVVFPGSGTGRPLENAEIQARGERLLRAAREATAR